MKKTGLPVMKKMSKRAEAKMKEVDVLWHSRQTLFQRVPAQASTLECCSVLLLPRAGPSQHLLARQAHNLICFLPAILSTNKPSPSFTWCLDSDVCLCLCCLQHPLTQQLFSHIDQSASKYRILLSLSVMRIFALCITLPRNLVLLCICAACILL